MGKISNVKFRVNGEEQVRAALTFLFENGCSWRGPGSKDISLDKKATHLFVNEASQVSYIDDDDEFFVNQSQFRLIEPKFKVKEILAMEITERPKTCLFGKTYYTDDLNAAIAGLEVADV